MRRIALRGFTLMELLVVMTIVALTMGAVLPSAIKWLDSAQQRAWRGDARAQLEALPLLAREAGASQQWDAESLRARMPELPADLELHVPRILSYGPSGAASGGQVEVFRKGGRSPLAHWDIEHVTGRVSP